MASFQSVSPRPTVCCFALAEGVAASAGAAGGVAAGTEGMELAASCGFDAVALRGFGSAGDAGTTDVAFWGAAAPAACET